MENIINSIIEIIFWINNNENKFLIQVLKNHDVLFRHSDKIANGDRSTNIFTVTYLIAYENNKFNNENVSVPVIIPSKVKIFNELFSKEKLELIFTIKLEKHTFFPNISSPIFLILKERLEFNDNICSIIKYELFIHIPHIINLKINCEGVSTWLLLKLDIKNFIEKYKTYPINNEFDINRIPLVVDTPKILLKYLSSRMFEVINVSSSSTSYNFKSIDVNKLWNILFIVFITISDISVFEFNLYLLYHISDSIADNIKSMAKMNAYATNDVFTNFFPVRIFSSSPKLNFCINNPVTVPTAAAGVASFISQLSIFSNAFCNVLTSFGVAANTLLSKKIINSTQIIIKK